MQVKQVQLIKPFWEKSNRVGRRVQLQLSTSLYFTILTNFLTTSFPFISCILTVWTLPRTSNHYGTQIDCGEARQA
jgi:hypothetical protein